MWKIFLISVGFCIFIPFQVEACASVFRGESLSQILVMRDIGLMFRHVEALKEVGVYTTEDLHQFSRRELVSIFSKAKTGVHPYVQRVETYLFARGESLARDFLVDDVGLSVQAANALERGGIRTQEDLLEWTASDLLALSSIAKVTVKNIQDYLFSNGKSLARDFLVEDVGLFVETAGALRMAGVDTVDSLRALSKKKLRGILLSMRYRLGGKVQVDLKKIETYLSYLLFREDPLVQDFLMNDVGLPFKKASILFSEGIRTEEDLLGWTESGLLALQGIGTITVANIKNYLSNKGKSLVQGVLITDIGLSPRSVEALKKVGIYTIEDLRKFSEGSLRAILPDGNRFFIVQKIRIYFLERRESLAQNFLVEIVGLSELGSGPLYRAGIHKEEDLLEWTESGLLALRGVGTVTVEGIKAYLFSRGKSLREEPLVHRVSKWKFF